MVKRDSSLNQIAGEVMNSLSQYIKVDRLILFGSYAYGEPRFDSDIDLAIVSEDFEQMSVLKKIELFSKVSVAIDSRIELLGFPMREYLHPQKASLLDFIKKKGRVLLTA